MGHHKTVSGGLPRLRDWETHPNSLWSTNSPEIPNPKLPQPRRCHPSGLQSWHCLLTSSVQGAGCLLLEGTQTQPDAVSGAPDLGDIPDFEEGAGWGTPAPPGRHPPILASWGHTGTNPVALLLLESRAGAVGVFGVPLGRSAPPSCSAGCCSSQGSACVLPSPGDTAAPRSPAGGSPHLPGHTTPESQDGGPVPRAARTPPPAPAAP